MRVFLLLWLSLLLGLFSGCGDSATQAQGPRAQVKAEIVAGDAARKKGDFQTAIRHFRTAADGYLSHAQTSDASEDWAGHVACLNQIGWDQMVYFGAFDEARKILLEAGAAATAHLPQHHHEALRQQHNLAVLSYYENKLDEALLLNQSLLKLRQQAEGDQRRRIAATHNNLGLVYRARGELAKAKIHFQRSLDLKIATLGPDHGDLATTYQNLGNSLKHLGDFESAVSAYQRAYDLRTKYLEPGHPDIGATALTLGKGFLDQAKLEQAAPLIEEALRIQENAYGRDHPHTAHSAWEMARIQVHQGEFAKAETALNQAMKVFQSQFGPANYHIADNLHYLGWLYWKRGELEQSRAAFEKALAVFEGNLAYQQGGVSPVEEAKVRCYRALVGVAISRYRQSQDTAHLNAALQAVDDALAVLTLVRRRMMTEATQLVMARQGRDIIGLGVEVALELMAKTGESRYAEKAFVLAETGKMAVLRDAIRQVEIQIVAGVSPALLDREKTLRDRGYQLDTQAAYQVRNGDGVEAETRRALIEHNLGVEVLLSDLEREFPKYFSLKYQLDVLNLTGFRRKIGPGQALVTYHIHDDRLTIFALKNQGELMVKQMALTGGKVPPRFAQDLDWLTPGRKRVGSTDLGQAIAKLRSGIVFEKRDVFDFYAQKLNRLLIEPIEEFLAGHDLIIVPDGPLAYLPFETLLKEKPEGSADWDLPYLLKSHGVAYTYAASLLSAGQQRSNWQERPQGIAFAPGFGDADLTGQRTALENERLQPLPHSLTEVDHIAGIFAQHGGELQTWTRQDADLATFKRVVGQGRVIHLATHARIDEAYPALSSLFFADAAPKEQVGMLYLGEIFGLEMEADLVVLSACETARGSMMRGEGVMGFVRGLYFAGAREVLVSQWKVADDSTASLMADFYENVFADNTPGQALRRAKLECVQAGASPFAWAGFVLHSRSGRTNP